MVVTVEKDALILFKQINEFESTEFDQCNILPFINRTWKKSFARRGKNLEAIIDRNWFHLDRRILKDPVILKTKIRLENEQLDNQHDPPS